MKKRIVSLILMTLCCSYLQAAPTTYLAGHAFINAQVGAGGIKTGVTANDGYKLSVGGVTYRVSGGYLINITPSFSLGPELGYMTYDKNYYSQQTGINTYTKTDQYSGFVIDTLAVANYHYSKHWYLIGKAGLANVFQTYTILPGSSSTNIKKSRVLPELGVGIGVNFTSYLGIDVNYATTFSGALPEPLASPPKATDDVANVESLSLGIHYIF